MTSDIKRPPRAISLFLLLCIAIAGYVRSPSASATSTDADFAPLAKTRNVDALEALAAERVAKNPKDDVALWYWARLVSGNAAKRDALIPRVEQCVKDLPMSARCHSALGSLYGAAAMSAGIVGGMKYVGGIKDAMVRAVELDPARFEMRRDLVQFYLQAPGIAGGSVRKANEHANEFAKHDAARAQLLRAEIQAYEKDFAKAEATLDAVKPGGDADLAEALMTAYANLGFGLVNASRHAEAQRLFERRLAAAPNNAVLHFGLGRALLEQKSFVRAVQSIERALQLDGKLSAHYRLGIAYQELGDKTKAIAAFRQFLSYQMQGNAANDARKRLAELGV